MPLSTEVFVMAIFIIGLPFFFLILKDRELKGRHFFLSSYIFLTFSNIFTVLEEFWLNTFFNILEHGFITIASIILFIAVSRLIYSDISEKKTGMSKVPRDLE